MEDRELKLNSLTRYSKASPVFILEEHGHCEVPAGCGGVVLRWRNPRAGIPLTLWLYTDGDSRFYLDGNVPSSARPLVTFGEHVLSLEISGIDEAFTVLMFAAVNRAGNDVHVHASSAETAELSIMSAADGSWRYSFAEPEDDSWMRTGFDDSDWPAMGASENRRPPENPDGDNNRYQVERLTEFGAIGLGVQGDSTSVWIRKAFTVPQPIQDH